MSEKVVLLLICFFSVFHNSFSQKPFTKFLLTGKVLDSQTKDGIPFVTIYCRRSGAGTSGDQAGNYAIQVDTSHHSDTLVFSAIGYKPTLLAVSLIPVTTNRSIYLDEAVVALQEITVTAQPAVEIIKQAIKNRPFNYGLQSHTLTGLYRITDREDGAFVRLVEAAVNIHDDDFMKKDSRVVDYLAVRHSKDLRTVKWKMDNLNSRTVEELLKPDLIKRPTRATHAHGFERGFFYAFERYAMLEGQEVYIISAKKNPGYQWPNYDAIFYVRVADLAIVRVDRDYSIQRPNWAKGNNVNTKIISDKLILKYNETDGKMYLNYFLWSLKGEVIEDKSKHKVMSFERNEELNIHKVSFEPHGKVRAAWDPDIYKIQEPYNKTFWENYAVSNTQLFRDVTKELNEKEDLEKQFLPSDDRYSVYDPGKRYTQDELKNDFKLFRRGLTEGHPALYRYTSTATFNRLFDSTYTLLSKPKTELEFYKLLTPLVAAVRCGHTQLRLSADHYIYNEHRTFYFPLQTQIVDGKLLISSNYPHLVKKDSSGRFMLRSSHPTLGIHERNVNSFTGNVKFLINGNTFSAAADFASIARQYQRGVFIGEETGGAAIGNTSNGELILTLPNTAIRMLIPLFRITNAVNDNLPGCGVIPDYTITYERSDLAKGVDKELQLALELAAAAGK